MGLLDEQEPNPQQSLLARLAAAVSPESVTQVEGFARLDLHRASRKGVPEVLLAEYKTAAQTLAIAERMLELTGRAIISRIPPTTLQMLEEAFGAKATWERGTADRVVVLRTWAPVPETVNGIVGIVLAGTSDLPAAEEAGVICREMGSAVHFVTDVGVAGLHRLFEPLTMLSNLPTDVIIVAAGMDGALPSVIAGLVDVPVIGLPTAVGYGLGGNGEAALMSMLQTCAPGLAVVNIDNGVGAGAMASLIARGAARARRAVRST